MSKLDINEVLTYLPHRYPFALIDKVIDFEPGKYLIAVKNVSYNEPFFTGHFPERPIMPGVLMIEALAQAAGLLIFKTANLTKKESQFFLAGVDNARFKKIVEPGDQLKLKVDIERTIKDFWKFKCEASVDGEIACTANIMNAKGGG